MPHTGPIIIVEDDPDDHQIISEVLESLEVANPLKFFFRGDEALQYLSSAVEQPLLILCDVNMPHLNGLDLRKVIDSDPKLKKKSIPFIFYSTAADKKDVTKAYEMTVQGFFEKGSNLEKMKKQLKVIIDYWRECKHPNSFNH
jgi:CheY-like chemotaxis protein